MLEILAAAAQFQRIIRFCLLGGLLHPALNVVISYLTAHLQDKSSAPVSLAAVHVHLVSREDTAKVVDCAGDTPVGRPDISTLEIATRADDLNTLAADKPWVPDEFSALPVSLDAFPGRRRGETPRATCSAFLGQSVGKVHVRLDFWKEKFDKDEYVFNIIEHGYRIPIKMTPGERSQHYRERNNQSARNEMPFVRTEVAGLVADGQVIAVEDVPLCCNPLSVAFKINMDGSIKPRLVIDLSCWVNKFIQL
jgi:hypothetical protein